MRRLLALLLLPLLSLPARAADQLLAGAAVLQTTPEVETFADKNKNRQHDPDELYEDLNGDGEWTPVWLAGYRGDRPALGIHDELSTRALALTKGKTTVLFITVDCVGYLFDEVAQVKQALKEKYGLPPENILLSATHDHSGPDTIGLWGPGGHSGREPAYLAKLRDIIVDCAGMALESRIPARLRFAKIRYAKPIEDCRPPKVINDLLLTMDVEDLQGGTIATLFNYAMHAEVLDEDNRLLTSDWPGAARDLIESKIGGVAMFFPADLGGMQSPYVLFHNFLSRRKVGRMVARKVLASLRHAAVLEDADITVRGRSLDLPVENPKFLGAIQHGLFGDAANYAHQRGDTLFLPSDLSFVRIGPAEFVTVPGEAFPEVGNVIRPKMKTDYPFVLGLCNNEIGYIVPADEWHDGGYEESMSLGKRTADLLLEALAPLIGD